MRIFSVKIVLDKHTAAWTLIWVVMALHASGLQKTLLRGPCARSVSQDLEPQSVAHSRQNPRARIGGRVHLYVLSSLLCVQGIFSAKLPTSPEFSSSNLIFLVWTQCGRLLTSFATPCHPPQRPVHSRVLGGASPPCSTLPLRLALDLPGWAGSGLPGSLGAAARLFRGAETLLRAQSLCTPTHCLGTSTCSPQPSSPPRRPWAGGFYGCWNIFALWPESRPLK